MVINRKLKIAAVLFAILSLVAFYYIAYIRLLKQHAESYIDKGLYKPAILCINEIPDWYVGKETKRKAIELAFVWAIFLSDKIRYMEVARDFEAWDEKACRDFHQTHYESISKILSQNASPESELSKREATELKNGCLPTFGKVLKIMVIFWWLPNFRSRVWG